MKKFIITTDSNADLPIDYIKQHNVTIIPQYYVFGDTVYGDELNLSPSEFYNKMANGDLPTSMANNPAIIRDKFEELIKSGFDILHLAFSSKLSGSYNNICMVARELEESYPAANIYIVDTLNATLGEGLLYMSAMDMKANGTPIDEICKWIDNNKNFCKMQFTVNDVKHLQRGGRISKMTSLVLGVVNIKPIIQLTNEGTLTSAGTARGRKKSLSSLVTAMEQQLEADKLTLKRIGIVHANCFDEAKTLADTIKSKHNVEIIINDISPSIGTHAGPGAIGLCYLGLPE